MLSNSTSGLTVLPPERDVTVVEEQHHQAALAHWSPPAGARSRPVVAELRPAPVSGGSYAGRPGVAVLLDGVQVGELTFRMAQRYGPMVEQVVRRGERPGAHATVKHGRRGLVEVELKLPAIGAVPPPIPPVPHNPVGRREPAAAPAATGKRAALWIGGVVGAVLVVVGVVGGHNSGDKVPSTPAVTDVAASVAPTAPAITTTQPAPATPVQEATPTLDPRPVTRAPDRPAPPVEVTHEPVEKAAPTTSAEPEVSGGGCDPNYAGGCVPIASDVDCAGGSGNGPAYFSGTARVVGKDIYKLDGDKNGIACDG